MVVSWCPPTPMSGRNSRGVGQPVVAGIIVAVAVAVIVGALYAAGEFSPKSSGTTGGPPYPVVFRESGLPARTLWSVDLNGTTISTNADNMTFFEASGAFPFAVGPIAGYSQNVTSGTVTVRGTPASVDVRFALIPTYSVTFHETGLAAGTFWSVNILGEIVNLSARTLSFALPNGSYSFTVAFIDGYAANLTGGTFDISGTPLSFEVKFTPVYLVSFVESGLAPHTYWSVDLNGTTQFDSGSSMDFSVPNGTYSYEIGAVTGYTSNQTGGSSTVTGANVTIYLNFSIETPLGLAFAWGPASNVTSPSAPGCVSGKECYAIEIASASSGITANGISFEARTASGGAVSTAGWTFTLITVAGANASASWSASGLCSGAGCTDVLAAGMTIVFHTGGTYSLLGDSIIAVGQGSFTGTVASVGLPA